MRHANGMNGLLSRLAIMWVLSGGLLIATRNSYALQSTGTGTVTFSNAAVLNPTVTFTSSGTYVLQLCANDGVKTTCSPVSITVLPAVVSPKVVVGPGGTIAGDPTTFPVSLVAGTTGLASVQFDLLLPPLVTTGTLASNVTAGAATTAAGKSVVGSAVSTSTYRVIVSGLNTNVIGAGILANMTFQLDPSLPAGSLPIGIQNVIGSDVNGVSVPMQSSGNTLTISANVLPVVSAGAAQSITLPSTAQMSATATTADPTRTLTLSWSEI